MADANQNTTGGEHNAPVTFSDEQKVAINDIIEQRLGRQKQTIERTATEAAEAKAAEKVRLLEEELAALKNKGTKKDDEHKDGEKEQWKSLIEAEKGKTEAERKRAEKAEADRLALSKQNSEIVKNVAIRDAIQGQETFQFHNFDTVRRLTEHLVSFDDESGKFIVKDETGTVLQNSSLQPMTLGEFYTKFASEHPYLVSSQAKGGSGAGESSRTVAGGLSKITCKADFKSVKDKVDYVNKFGQEAFEALPLK